MMDSKLVIMWVLAIISTILFLTPYFNKKIPAGQLKIMSTVNSIIFIVVIILGYLYKSGNK